MSNFILIKYEYFATVKQFFDTYPDIPTEPLADAWCWGSGCNARNGTDCSDWDRNCDHPRSVSTDVIVMIQILTWNINGEVLLDVFSYPGDNQAGYIFHKNIPVIEIGDGDLEFIDDVDFDIDLIEFQIFRSETFCDGPD